MNTTLHFSGQVACSNNANAQTLNLTLGRFDHFVDGFLKANRWLVVVISNDDQCVALESSLELILK